MPILGAILLIAVGLVLAFMGKRFVWLLVGAAGFILAYDVITFLIPGSGMFEVGAAVVAGLVLGWLATRFTKLLLWIAAFILIGHVAFSVANWFSAGPLVSVILFLIGGAIGLALLRFFKGPALVVITAVAGAIMVGNGVSLLLYGDKNVITWVPALATGLVAIGGIIYQLRGEGSAETPPA